MKYLSGHPVAEAFLKKFGMSPHGMTLRFHCGRWWHWDGRRYIERGEEQLRAQITQVAKQEADTLRQKTGEQVHDVTGSLVSNTIQALAGMTLVDERLEQPVWLPPEIDGSKFIALSNGLVDLDALITNADKGKFRSHTPQWFSPVCLPYPYMEKA